MDAAVFENKPYYPNSEIQGGEEMSKNKKIGIGFPYWHYIQTSKFSESHSHFRSRFKLVKFIVRTHSKSWVKCFKSNSCPKKKLEVYS